MKWRFHHYVMAFFIHGNIIGSELYFDMSTAIPTFLWLVQDDIHVFILFFELFVSFYLKCIFLVASTVLGLALFIQSDNLPFNCLTATISVLCEC